MLDAHASEMGPTLVKLNITIGWKSTELLLGIVLSVQKKTDGQATFWNCFHFDSNNSWTGGAREVWNKVINSLANYRVYEILLVN